jgi:uracil-DNA glycosylase
VANGVPIPPSLKNIYKELSAEYNVPPPTSGNLTAWARQGILLLNATLTVRASEAGSHQNQGWINCSSILHKSYGKHLF